MVWGVSILVDNHKEILNRSHSNLSASFSKMSKAFAIITVALFTANCSSQPSGEKISKGGIDAKYGVAASPRVVEEGQNVPKGGGRQMVGKPYTIAGKRYTPYDKPIGYKIAGSASWYGAAFHGRRTANGEIFDKNSLLAAHPTMPLPSYARVTNQKNGNSIIVRVNDRGPYHGARVMDVSERVAELLEFKRMGIAPVSVEYLGAADLKGSDDRKLMASLRIDGNKAPFSGPTGRTLVASNAPFAPSSLPEVETKTASITTTTEIESTSSIKNTVAQKQQEQLDASEASKISDVVAKPTAETSTIQSSNMILKPTPLPPERIVAVVQQQQPQQKTTSQKLTQQNDEETDDNPEENVKLSPVQLKTAPLPPVRPTTRDLRLVKAI